MIPKTGDDLKSDFKYQDMPSKTYRLSGQNITGYTDQIEAVKQAIYLILNIERYESVIYSWNYGLEVQDLIGMDINYVLPELKRRISEALLQDSRIKSVNGFVFETLRGKVHVTFNVITIYGDVKAERVVNV